MGLWTSGDRIPRQPLPQFAPAPRLPYSARGQHAGQTQQRPNAHSPTPRSLANTPPQRPRPTELMHARPESQTPTREAPRDRHRKRGGDRDTPAPTHRAQYSIILPERETGRGADARYGRYAPVPGSRYPPARRARTLPCAHTSLRPGPPAGAINTRAAPIGTPRRNAGPGQESPARKNKKGRVLALPAPAGRLRPRPVGIDAPFVELHDCAAGAACAACAAAVPWARLWVRDSSPPHPPDTKIPTRYYCCGALPDSSVAAHTLAHWEIGRVPHRSMRQHGPVIAPVGLRDWQAPRPPRCCHCALRRP